MFHFEFRPLEEKLVFADDSIVFGLEIQDTDNQTIRLTSVDFELQECKDECEKTVLRFNRKDNAIPYNMDVQIDFIKKNKEILGTISVKLHGNIVVKRVQFPYVEYDKVNTFDSLLMSTPWGDNITRPTRTIKQYSDAKSDFWLYDYVKCGENEVIYSYPSIMAMQYMVLHNTSRSLYLACYGTGDDTMTFNAKVKGKHCLALSINHYPFIKEGTWESSSCSIALLKGDWHSAADLYSYNMKDKFVSPDIPGWMKEGWHGWVGVRMRSEGAEPSYRYCDLPAIFEKVKAVGMNTLQITGWAYNGFDTMYPDFRHDPLLGTPEEFKQALVDIKAMGGHGILYTNGRLVDPRSEFYKNGGDQCLCVNEQGEPYIETYNTSAEFRIACPACEEYGSYVAKEIENMILKYGAHAAQIDQISCNYAYFCFDKNHPHKTPASNFLPGITKELKAIREVHKKLDENFFTWIEGCHERFGQFYDVHQGHGEELTWSLGEAVPEQFSYNYPDYIVTGFSKNLQQLCHSYIQGKPFDVSIRNFEDKDFLNLLKDLVAVRKKYKEYFVNGRLRHHKGIDGMRNVKAQILEKSDGSGLLLNLWQQGAEPGEECSAAIVNPKQDWAVKQVYPQELTIPKSNVTEIKWVGPVATIIFEK